VNGWGAGGPHGACSLTAVTRLPYSSVMVFKQWESLALERVRAGGTVFVTEADAAAVLDAAREG